jgi:hypothetical protein
MYSCQWNICSAANLIAGVQAGLTTDIIFTIPSMKVSKAGASRKKIFFPFHAKASKPEQKRQPKFKYTIENCYG